MRRELLMPKLGLTMTEGSIADWMVQPGQSIQKGQALFVVETDKVANEIPAEQSGTLLEIVVPVGTTVPVGTLIGVWDDGSEADEARETADSFRAAPEHARSSSDAQPTASVSQDAASNSPSSASAESPTVGRVVASPLARRLARERGVSLNALHGTGPKGRIVARDVPDQDDAADRRCIDLNDDDAYTIITPTSLQTTIARRLTQGKQDTPHFYLALEAEVSRLMALRKEINDAKPTVRLTLNHFIVMAVARALSDMPEANRVWSDNGILAFKRIDVGVAVNTEQGLMAPAVRDVGAVGIGELARRLDAVATAARQGTLSTRDMGMPAITVSNAGMHNVTYMSSIINPGQAMILGVGSVKGVFRPDDAGQPVLRQEMGLVLSADHRIMDGVSALRFLNRIVELLAQPARLLVD